jgi:hypothetical protein
MRNDQQHSTRLSLGLLPGLIEKKMFGNAGD